MELLSGTSGSMYTIESLLDKTIEVAHSEKTLEAQVQTISGMQEANPDKGDSPAGKGWINTIDTLKKYKEGNTPFTLILDDPLSNCSI